MPERHEYRRNNPGSFTGKCRALFGGGVCLISRFTRVDS